MSQTLITDYRRYIIEPTLQEINQFIPYSLAAEQLLTGTVAVEGGDNYLKEISAPQTGGQGIFQIDNQPHLDVKGWLRYEAQQKDSPFKGFYAEILARCNMIALEPGNNALVYNLKYATIIARIIYHHAKEPLPKAYDAIAMAEYHKAYYNTSLGAADVSKNIRIFEGVINAK